MAGLKFILGMLPSTSKVEDADIQLRKEYEDFKAFGKSEVLKRYLELGPGGEFIRLCQPEETDHVTEIQPDRGI